MQQPVTTPRRRPGAVVGAGGVLLLMAFGSVLYGATGLALMPGIIDRFQAAAFTAGVTVDEIDSATRLLRGVPIAAAFVGVVGAVLLVVLAIGTLRGNSAVRVAAWVVCGVGLVGGGLAAVFGFAQRIGSWSDDAVIQALTAAHPGWWLWTSAVLSVLQALGYVVVALLLASPAANAYFRRTPSLPPGPTGSAPPPPPPVDPTDWQRPSTTPAAM
ncbi:hypothetical protein Afe04nite_49260 [Asanoa ferruginea]|uniref:hypothetical protein n=1 Tax=Asanoa ferruginea TaxID=53367 RepID=UPI000E24935F|nr:hypothetical protein [Asanoa ferruginea]GIF50387.1 hypothetical protein Afe04nite_49260 [Asanoa ferruginea]